jgi:hypothetical protein
MKEEHLHFIWKFQLFDKTNLKSTYGEKIEILHLGYHNFDQGPDFLNASIKIGEQKLYGNIEIHIRNEHWYQHRHEKDSNYDNVILHVVLEPTDEIYTLTSQKTLIPILVLSSRISADIIANIAYLMAQKSAISCKGIVRLPEKIKIEQFKEKLFVERLLRKSLWIRNLIQKNNNDYETSFYQAMLYGFGLKTNADSFLAVAINTPQKILAKNSNNLFKLEALLLGQAGLIEVCDEYSERIHNEYAYLSQLYSLQSISSPPLFAKMLPASFPTLRLAQFAAFVHNKKGLYSILTNFVNYNDIKKQFEIEISAYWQDHYRFGKAALKKGNRLSPSFIDKILINVILPFVFLLEIEHEQEPTKSIALYQSLEPENNKIIRNFIDVIPLEYKSSYDSQAIIEWFQSYCTKKNCLNCPIGFQILRCSSGD